jgi:hypothetical protein
MKNGTESIRRQDSGQKEDLLFTPGAHVTRPFSQRHIGNLESCVSSHIGSGQREKAIMRKPADGYDRAHATSFYPKQPVQL